MSRFTGALENITQIMHDFDANHDHEWQAGFNGRSGGYIVLYKGFKVQDTHTKTICNHCGIRTGEMFKTALNKSAAHIIVVHNHQSGDSEQSSSFLP